MRISLSRSRSNGFKKWSDAHPAKPDPTIGSDQETEYPMIMPAVTLGLFYSAYIARLTRGGMLDVLSQDFIRTARAKGVPDHEIILKHSLRGGLLPVVAFLGPAFAGLLSGSFVVEKVFNVPGIGQEFIKSVFNRDYPLVLGTVAFFGVLIVVFNLMSDIIQTLMDPKSRN